MLALFWHNQIAERKFHPGLSQKIDEKNVGKDIFKEMFLKNYLLLFTKILRESLNLIVW